MNGVNGFAAMHRPDQRNHEENVVEHVSLGNPPSHHSIHQQRKMYVRNELKVKIIDFLKSLELRERIGRNLKRFFFAYFKLCNVVFFIVSNVEINCHRNCMIINELTSDFSHFSVHDNFEDSSG